MLIVTPNGEAISAHHTVRFFIQAESTTGSESADVPLFRLILQLTSRQRVIAADGLDRSSAQALFRELVRAWTRGQACVEIAGCLKRIHKGESTSSGFSEVCL